MMTVKILLAVCPFFFLKIQTGICFLSAREIHVKAGEMVVLQCPDYSGYHHGDSKVVWTSHTTQKMYVTNMSSAELEQMGVLVHGRSLLILSASVNHRGNYSCSAGNGRNQFWFTLTVNIAPSKEYEERTKYTRTCYTQDSCILKCPDVNIPAVNTPDITHNSITWHKEGESFPKTGYFSSVEEKDHGVYTCTRSYLYHGQIYNMTFPVELNVKPKKPEITATIVSPHNNDVFHVDLGSTVVIDCKAVTSSNFDGVFWLMGESFVSRNTSFPVFYNYTRESKASEKKITASLVFTKVSEEDISNSYTCKLQSVLNPGSVTITLAQKAQPSYISLALSIVAIVVVMAVTVVIYVKLKIDITLFFRDTLGCRRSISDGKTYDAFLMCYKSDTDAGLNAPDRKWLESVLEERFGYSLCLYDRNVLPGEAIASAVLDCIEESRTVVLVPTSPDPGLGSGLLSAIHEALVERQTRLIFIRTETTDVSTSGSLSKALQLLSEAGDCVTWMGRSSKPPSSSFWKQLRYYLPASRQAPKIWLLPQTIQNVASW